MQELSRFCCQNKKCPDYGKSDANNLVVRDTYGKTGSIRLLYCQTCKSRFSERKGSPLFRMKLDEEKAISVLEHISNGYSARQTEQRVGVNRNTVLRYARLAGEHGEALQDELLVFSPQTNPEEIE